MSEAQTATTTEAPATMAETLYPTPAAEAAAAEGTSQTEQTSTAPADSTVSLGEAKPEGEATADPAATTEEAAAAPVLDIKLPEGFEVNTEALDSFKTLAAKAGLKAEGAQELVDLYAAEVKAHADAQAKAWNDTIGGWKNELEALPDFATAEKRTEAQTIIGRALDEYGSAEARQAFDLTGAGWNPHIVQMFHKMAKALSEGGPVAQGRPSGRPASTAERLYGQPNS